MPPWRSDLLADSTTRSRSDSGSENADRSAKMVHSERETYARNLPLVREKELDI